MILLGTCLLPGLLPGVQPLREQWRTACAALSAGEPVRALEGFREFERWYGQEPRVREPAFRELQLRLWGLAALQAGAPREAAGILESWLAEFPDQEAFRSFIRFQLLGLYGVLGEEEKQARALKAFLDDYPELPEASLVRWNMADEAIAAKDYPRAARLLERIIGADRLPPAGRDLARCARALVALQEGDPGTGLRELERTAASSGNRMTAFWRALAAPALARAFLREGASEKAIQATGWFDPLEESDALMRNWLKGLQNGLGSGGSPVREAIWLGHWHRQVQRLEAAVREARDTANGAGTLYRLTLRTLVKNGDHPDTRVLAEAILQSPGAFGHATLIEAHKARIEAQLQARDWEAAAAAIREFETDWPDDPDLPEIRFMSARSAAARSDWDHAVGLSGDLIRSHPEHPSRLSWEMLHAGWLLRAGQPGKALKRFRELAETVPDPWKPIVRFRIGQCHQQEGRFADAVRHYARLADDPAIGPSLRALATTSLLKVHLRRGNGDAFFKRLSAARSAFPEGRNRLKLETLAGSWYQANGQPAKALERFAEVALTDGSESGFAREQISRIHARERNYEALGRHAVDWIRRSLRKEVRIPGQAFRDCLRVQKQLQKNALPVPLAADLLDLLDVEPDRLPVAAFLEVLSARWPAYATGLGIAQSRPLDYFQRRAIQSAESGNFRTGAGYRLFVAGLLESSGRHDSADTQRIAILRSGNPRHLPAEALLVVASTAARYDFPEAGSLLEYFLDHWPDSPERPRALLHSARLLRQTDQAQRATGRLRELVREWPDAREFQAASLELARWLIEDQAPEKSLPLLEDLLESPQSPPAVTAEALLLRARAAFELNETEKAFLSLLRILNLYPDLEAVAAPAAGLFKLGIKDLPVADQTNWIQRLNDPSLRQSLSDAPSTRSI
jgi:tetratricopeptide (TPR) repeat protein